MLQQTFETNKRSNLHDTASEQSGQEWRQVDFQKNPIRYSFRQSIKIRKFYYA